MQSVSGERKRNQRKSPLTPKKSFRKEESPPAIAMRVGGRVKKAKIPFDPSDAVSSRRQTVGCVPLKRFAGKDGPVTQYVCCQCKKADKPEAFVTCKEDCASRIHLHCLQSICENFGENEEKSWECNNCQLCSVCRKGNSIGKSLLKCYICFSYFHVKCHGSEDKIKIVKENRFVCTFCEKSRKMANMPKESALKKSRAFSQTRKPSTTECKLSSSDVGFLGFNANEVVESSSSSSDESNHAIQTQPLPSRRPSAVQNRVQHPRSSVSDNRSSIEEDASIDASDWSTDQVYKYFNNIFPRHAHVFKDHEIDGATLYLLKRRDIVNGFDIKIGPALKIYSHVLKLQTKNNDPTLSWH